MTNDTTAKQSEIDKPLLAAFVLGVHIRNYLNREKSERMHRP